MVGLTWKAVFVKSLNRASVINITNRSNKKKWRSSWNLDELNEFSLAGGSKKQENDDSLSLPCNPLNR